MHAEAFEALRLVIWEESLAQETIINHALFELLTKR